MNLREYRKKRSFSVTGEPRGPAPEREGHAFVIQKHSASSLHFDFRLELEGALKSWAVPKGPSLDPTERRLAVQTEDHPLDYADFEGAIPAGQYGGGTVIVWDRGTWKPRGDPRKALRSGTLKFELFGERLRGGWALVRIRSRQRRYAGKTWLLVKERDAEARPGYDIVAAKPESVLSSRSLEVATGERGVVSRADPGDDGSDAAPRPKGAPSARRAALPDFVPPQLATLASAAPTGGDWLHEIKLDGYRLLCRVQRRKARLLTRTAKDWTGRFPTVAEAALRLHARQALLDGEVAVALPNGTTSFQALQNLEATPASGRLAYFAFDLLHLDGFDLTATPLEERKALLRSLVGEGEGASVIRYSEHVVGTGPEFFAQACGLGLEGVVAKRRDGPYRSGHGSDWLKIKCQKRQEVVIGGYTPPRGSRVGIGALLVGVSAGDGRLEYAGKVGTGFDEATLRQLRALLGPLEQVASPFTALPPGSAAARFVRPDLVAEVAFTEWTSDGRLRHPSFLGLREDKPPGEVVRENPQELPAEAGPEEERMAARRRAVDTGETVEVAGVRLTHPDRVLYPGQGITKADLARFYATIADSILPALAGRPTTLVRCPEGAGQPCFYQKHSGPWAPSSLRRVKIQEAKKVGEYLVVEDLAGLVGLVQIGMLEIHTWNTLADRLERPDRLVFDLDPDSTVPWERVIEGAFRVRRLLEDVGLVSFVKTTGGKGLHVVVPLDPVLGWKETAEFGRDLAVRMAREDPEAYTAEMSKARRAGRTFIDYLRNHRGATSIAAYSTRASKDAPVSTPVSWDELGPGLRSDSFNVANLKSRLDRLSADPWKAYGATRQRLTPARRKAVAGR